MKLLGRDIGIEHPIFFIAGPDTLESQELAIEVAGHIKAIADRLGILYVFKGSFDKANRSSHKSYRGPGLEGGLKIMENVKKQIGVPVLTDVHEDTPVNEVAAVIDVIQTPAFLCRQTNFMQKWAMSGRPINVKKGQFMSPWEMGNVIEKMTAVAPHQFMLCERGFSFGYNNLVADMRGLAIMRKFAPVVFDSTHTVQLPGGQGNASGGMREMIPVLARAAVGAGVAGLFMETHPDPDSALCDGPNSLPLKEIEGLLETLVELDRVVKRKPLLESSLKS
ncbi:2-dehydro-3-deoxyphosphooctonate aldolase (KDO 8-P synthase) [Panacagrimonas perspica]|uniref:2-dehydro-3-deoxyphosphooctonate aldolase n=1 Tax=Panacagrimonas perspica TaxID=381431 RepID=A0A4S3KA58_9GAMM|nr:3-deoxy-8-phosphooctulonate synthase [Panacagrimonas perspica]TDU32268.1 2-dehydro-3-deoxyphosphooctonate aldolase (KDO 8-P synthase) [Panacagrimonas perspica]THD05213.1 3-deoxy-8-phosphooctulonate synthase [Panacagrimonas perspica]